MLINEIIAELFKDLDYNAFYIFKPDGIELDNYITFDTTVKNSWFSDNNFESNTYMVTINILTKDIKKIPEMINQIKEIIDDNPYCYNFLNRGNSFIKDTEEYFTACTFNMQVFPDE